MMPSLFTNSVYVSISSFDTATMQGIFSFLDTQVALYHYLISRVRAGNCASDSNLLERATTTTSGRTRAHSRRASPRVARHAQ